MNPLQTQLMQQLSRKEFTTTPPLQPFFQQDQQRPVSAEHLNQQSLISQRQSPMHGLLPGFGGIQNASIVSNANTGLIITFKVK